MGSAGRKYEAGQIHRSNVMAAEGLYDDGLNGIRRLTEPELRVKDQDRDGVQAEVLYCILGAAQRLRDPEAEIEMMRIYNEWLAGFCASHPERFAGLAAIPSHSIDAAVDEIKRVAARGAVRGVEIANTHDLKPLFHPDWYPVWAAANEAKLPSSLPHNRHAKDRYRRGLRRCSSDKFRGESDRFSDGDVTHSHRYHLRRCPQAYPDNKIVIGGSGIGWIPYILDHIDLEWEEQFKDLTLEMKPSDYWHRQCYATYQSDKVGTRLLDFLGEDNIGWGSDFPTRIVFGRICIIPSTTNWGIFRKRFAIR